MEYKDYKVWKIEVSDGVAFVTIDNPPINVINEAFWVDMIRFFEQVKGDGDVRVIVFKSADPKFFISHFDVQILDATPVETPDTTPSEKPKETIGWKKIFLEFRTLPKVTIAQVEGICGGGGNEFILSLDMRFGAKGKAVFSQTEAAIGIIAGGGGTHFLTKLLGRSRAMEAMLGLTAFSAELAERYGWINRAIDADKIDQFVKELAYKIAYVPAKTIGLVKKSIVAAETLSREEALIEEDILMGQAMALPETRRRMKEFLESGGQSRERELEVAERQEK